MYIFRFLLFSATIFCTQYCFSLEQACHAVIMVRPAHFGYNGDTAETNTFQNRPDHLTYDDVHQKALDEFDRYVTTLLNHDIEVLIFQDTPSPHTPDSLFPNNWISFHEDGTVIIYPMLGKNRREERLLNVIPRIREHFHISNLIDLHYYEKQNRALEGTGSIVFDHVNNLAYCNLSTRVDRDLLETVCDQLGYTSVVFRACDNQGLEIYHTNVLMFMGTDIAVVCLESIADPFERKSLAQTIALSGKELISITREQMSHFCGNMLEVINTNGERFIVMSEQAYDAFKEEQIQALGRHARLIHVPIETIESVGGGGARCMLAGIHLPFLHQIHKK